jgi:hypothetical protein
LPSSAQLAAALASDDEVIDVREVDDLDDAGEITHDPGDETEDAA